MYKRQSEDQELINPAGIPGVTPFTRGIKINGHENGTWDIRALIDDSTPELANKAALNELLNGSTSLFMIWIYIIVTVLSPSALVFLANRFIK